MWGRSGIRMPLTAEIGETGIIRQNEDHVGLREELGTSAARSTATGTNANPRTSIHLLSIIFVNPLGRSIMIRNACPFANALGTFPSNYAQVASHP